MTKILLALSAFASLLTAASATYSPGRTAKYGTHPDSPSQTSFQGKSSGKSAAKSSGKTSAKSFSKSRSDSKKQGVRAPYPGAGQKSSPCLLTAICTNVQICTNEMITPSEVGHLSYDSDGSLPSMSLSQNMGFAAGTTQVTLYVVGKHGEQKSCKALVCALECQMCPTQITVPKGSHPTISAPAITSPSKSGKNYMSKSGKSTGGRSTSKTTDPTTSRKIGSSKSYDSTATSRNGILLGGKGKGAFSASPPPLPQQTGGKKTGGKKSKIRARALMSKQGKRAISTSGTSAMETSSVSHRTGKRDASSEFCSSISSDAAYFVSDRSKDCINPPIAQCVGCQVCAGDKVLVDSVDAGSYDRNSAISKRFLDDYGPFELADNGKSVTLTVVNEANLFSKCNASITVTTCRSECTSKVLRFDLIDSLNNAVIADLPKYIRYPEIYLRDFNIVAVAQGCPGKRVRSVLWTYKGRATCSKHEPFSLFGDRDSFIFPIGGPYDINAVPYATKDCTGIPGESLSQEVYALGPDRYLGCPGAPCYFDLYNADSHEYVQAIKQSQKICLPEYDLNIKAAVINCDGGRVRSVHFRITGDQSYESVQSGVYFYVYGASGWAKYSAGNYTITATTYAAKAIQLRRTLSTSSS